MTQPKHPDLKPELTADDRRRLEAKLLELLDGLDELDGRRSDVLQQLRDERGALRDELRAVREALR